MSFEISDKKRIQYVCEDIILKLKYNEKLDTVEALVFIAATCTSIQAVFNYLTGVSNGK